MSEKRNMVASSEVVAIRYQEGEDRWPETVTLKLLTQGGTRIRLGDMVRLEWSGSMENELTIAPSAGGEQGMSVFDQRIRERAMLVNVAANSAWDTEAAMGIVESNLFTLASESNHERDTPRHDRVKALIAQQREIRCELYQLLIEVGGDR